VQDLSGEIDASLEYIESQQAELSKTLDSYESSLRETYESTTDLPLNPVDSEREYSYDLAESLNKQLDDMGKQLNDVVQELGKGESMEGNDLDAIVQILGQHLSSLQWLDGSVNSMTSTILDIERKSDAMRSR
jgi:nuclear pore complex protein Nup62